MKYYEMHEDVYKDLKEKGYISWDRNKDANDLYGHGINIALESSLPKYFPTIKDQKALDLGTGTGTVALFLAKQGFNATGFDMSSTAIDMAIDNAKGLGVNAEFMVKDINTVTTDQKCELIVDSSFFHCIVPFEEREKCFSFVCNSLSDDGFFFMHTMIQSDDMSGMLSAEHIFLEDDILWSTGKDSWDMSWEYVRGKRVFPHRRISTQDKLEEEIRRNGFKIVESKTKKNQGNPLTYMAWLKTN